MSSFDYGDWWLDASLRLDDDRMMMMIVRCRRYDLISTAMVSSLMFDGNDRSL